MIFESVRSSRKATTRHENTVEDIALLKEEVAQLRAVVSKLSPDDTNSMKIVNYSQSSGENQSNSAILAESPTAPAVDAAAASSKFSGLRYDTENNYIIIPAYKTADTINGHLVNNYVMTSNSLVARIEEHKHDQPSQVVVNESSIGGSFTNFASKILSSVI